MIPLYALAASAFAIGTTEFVIVGILPDVARDLGVALPTAGWLVSGYALGVAAGAPLLAVLTSRLRRKAALQWLMLLFIAGNLGSALAAGFAPLLAARIIASFAHGAFFGIGSVVAASLVPQVRQASAVALMFSGLTLANIIGVPLGTLVGQAFGWRATFWGVTGLGLVSQMALWRLLPARGPADAQRASLAQEATVLRDGAVWRALLTTVLGFGGLFAVLTYVAPLLETVGGFSPKAVAALLLLFGAGLTVGNVGGGKLADRLGTTVALKLALLAVAGLMAVLAFGIHRPAVTIATLFAWGAAAFATVPALQMRVMERAAHAPNLAATLNIGAFNVGNALGAWLGGAALAHGQPLTVLPWLAAAMAVAALGVTQFGSWVDRGAGEVCGEGV